ncbi:hypothetical protein [Pseudarthrobacter sp. NS4]|uniref:hypothetical protein n=1 Tax=Pseudarthrobacter sp. NS4 TaxID=2973976 RepID=UPI002161FCEA|nr:hypothetical protein [Pseudarthrobacter sp. NS4]
MSDTAGSRSDGFVDQLLLEAGLDDDGELRPALLQLRALGAVAPEPSAEIAALLQRAEAAAPAVTTEAAQAPAAEPTPAGDAAAVAPAEPTPAADAAVASGVTAPSAAAPVDELAARRRAKRRVTLTALSLAVSLSAGGAVAAASNQGFRDSFSQAVTSFVTGSGALPAVNQSEEPAVKLPAVPATPSTVPAAPAPAAPVEAPSSNIPAPPEEAAEDAATPRKPADVPAAKDLPTTVPEDLTNGVGKPPQVPVPGVPELPLPGTLPAVPLR